MSNSPREKVLLVVFPSIMIVLLWFGWFRPTKLATTTTTAFVAARASAPSAATLTAARMETKKVQDEQAAEESRKKQLEAEWQRLQASYAGQAETANTINQIAELLRQHDLKWIDGKVVRDGTESQAGKLYTQTISKLRGPPPAGKTAALTGQIDYSQKPLAANTSIGTNPQPQTVLWKVEFAGSYADVLAALQSLSTTIEHVVPVELRMCPAKPGLKSRLWTLILAI